jgi:hypothetical protein
MVAFAAILVWWQRPFIVKESFYNGAWNMETTVRRGFNGRLYHHGTTTRYFANGKKAVELEIDGAEAGFESNGVDWFPGTRYWHEDGRELTWRESLAYGSLEYLPREMNGQPVLTEPEWRAHLREKKEEYDKIDAEFEPALAAINQGE